MTPVDVVWLSLREGTAGRLYWDQAILDACLKGRLGTPGRWPEWVQHDSLDTVPEGRGAVVVIPARHHARLVREINEALAPLPWVVLILCGDEEGSFPVEQLWHPCMRVWVQTPQPGRRYPQGWRPLVNGSATDAYRMLRPVEKTTAWSFSGQVTHPRRHECAAALHRVQATVPGELVETQAFAAGLDHEDYFNLLARTKVAPCPSGPVTADTFRLAEALDAGCVPVVDTRPSHGPAGYWPVVFGVPPFPVLESWEAFPAVLDGLLADWPATANRVGAWWRRYLRGLAVNLRDDVETLSGRQVDPGTLAQQITVLMPSSSIPGHPDTGMVETVIDSVQKQLPGVEVVLMLDGLPAAYEARRADYAEYVRRVLDLARYQWANVLPVVYESHEHQSGMTRAALDLVTTPLVLFVEHDCPIAGDIDWPGLVDVMLSGKAGVVRLHHEAAIHPEHEHLMLGPVEDVDGVPLRPSIQWSQRPHLARTDIYRRMLAEKFEPDCRMMIEDRMHSVVQTTYHVSGLKGWEKYSLFVYAPQGDEIHGMKRSWHLDGRGTDEKIIEA